MPDFIAHSHENLKPEQWQKLTDHLQNTAELAGRFAAEFDSYDWAYLAGLLHDLGKTSQNFQNRIHQPEIGGIFPKDPHSTDGAIYAEQLFPHTGRIISYLVAGHHAGLPDWMDDMNSSSTLMERLKTKPKWDQDFIKNFINDKVYKPKKPNLDTSLDLYCSTWVRMLFSCLVDADFLDTETFMTPEKNKQRGNYRTLKKLLSLFEKYMEEKIKTSMPSSINEKRRNILETCIKKSAEKPGLFTLTVPTGGGKTLSSMAFALHHAVYHKKERIIYVIPYTSIIEQTADVFRTIFSDDVIEHHSNFDSHQNDDENSKYKLATENWDAPIIVTTTVQFFESLFASRSSRCRKLHNIVNSVVILDEPQLLPTDFLSPILLAIRELQKNYKVTFLFTSATQPAFQPQASLAFPGLPDLQEIIPDPKILHKEFVRTRLEIIQNLEPVQWDTLASKLQQHPCVLCIVNKRKDARELWEKMPPGTYHLSALMCGAHRSEKINEIKEKLKNNSPVRVVSTQLVEAGVDFDFPVVYRAVAGLDSIAQAAGRCNREGKLNIGIVYIFEPEGRPPAGFLRQAGDAGRNLLKQYGENSLQLECFDKYFRNLYWMRSEKLDRENIISLLKNNSALDMRFRTVAEKFHIIDESAQRPVVVAWKEGAKWIEILKKIGQPERWLLRKLQRYTVMIPVTVHEQLLRAHDISEVHPGIYIQEKTNLYHEELGLCPDYSGIYDAEELIK